MLYVNGFFSWFLDFSFRRLNDFNPNLIILQDINVGNYGNGQECGIYFCHVYSSLQG